MARPHGVSRLAVGVAVVTLASCSTGPVPVAVVQPTTSTGASAGLPQPLPSTSLPAASPAAVLPGDPDPVLTPGATNPAVTQADIHSTICVPGWTATVRPPVSYTNALKTKQIAAYGYADHALGDYEEDHLISLEIGGAPRDPRNLWPEPYAVTLPDGRPVGARVKDQLENRLHALVCAGAMPLAVAQDEIARDWIGHWLALSGQAPASSQPSPGSPPGATPVPTTSPTAGPTAPPGGAIFVHITRLTSPVGRGHFASVTAATLPGADCGIEVDYKSGPSTASGLEDRSASSAGSVSWTWRVGTGTTVGTWPVTVTCATGDAEASATMSFRVT